MCRNSPFFWRNLPRRSQPPPLSRLSLLPRLRLLPPRLSPPPRLRRRKNSRLLPIRLRHLLLPRRIRAERLSKWRRFRRANAAVKTMCRAKPPKTPPKRKLSRLSKKPKKERRLFGKEKSCAWACLSLFWQAFWLACILICPFWRKRSCLKFSPQTD